MIVKLLTEHHLEFLSLKGGCRGSSESTLVKMSNCWKSHALVLKAGHVPGDTCAGANLPQGHNLNKLGRDPLGHATYHIARLYA